MKIDKAEEIIDNMYKKRMSQMEEKTNEGLIIHLETKVEFTQEEEASVIILRELQILRRKLADSIPKSELKNDLKHMKNAKATGVKQLLMKKGVIGYLEKLLREE